MRSIECMGARVCAAVTVCSLTALSGACDGRSAKVPADTTKALPTAPQAPAESGGTGVRAKGEEGSMGSPSAPQASASQPNLETSAALFGMVGLSGAGGGGTVGRGVPAAKYAAGGGGPLGAPSEREALDVAPARHLDPNARYATTYRPGGAALAAFDAAVARGQIPASLQGPRRRLRRPLRAGARPPSRRRPRRSRSTRARGGEPRAAVR